MHIWQNCWGKWYQSYGYFQELLLECCSIPWVPEELLRVPQASMFSCTLIPDNKNLKFKDISIFLLYKAYDVQNKILF